MKRKLCSILVIVLMLASCLTAFAADADAVKEPVVPKDVVETVYEQAVKALIEKGVVSGYEDGTYKPENSITRAEACTIIVKYLAPSQEALEKAPANTFTDMKGSEWAATFVNYAVDKSIVKGDTKGTFRPENAVTYDEMATMLVNALGYTAKDLTGTWPTAYVNKAKELGIFADINVAKAGTTGANRGDVALMLSSLDKYKEKDSAKKAANDLMVAAGKKSTDVKSMTYQMNMIMDMSVAGVKVGTTMTGDASIINNPLAMSMKMKMDMGALGKMDMENYMVTENGTVMMYTLAAGSWMKQPVGDESAMQQYNAQENLELYLNGFDSIRVEGKDTVNGKSATKLYCTLADDYFEQALGMAGMEEQLETTGVDADYIKEMYKGVSFDYDIWIDDATGMPVKYYMNMADMMKQLMANMAKADSEMAEAATLVSYDKVVMSMTITGVDNVKEIVLPEAAKSAQLAQLVTPPAITSPGAVQ